VLDGVFVEQANESPRFVPARAMSKDELHKIVERGAVRVVKWLRKHGYIGTEDDAGSNETRALTFDEMLARAASQRGTIEIIKDSRGESAANAGNLSNARPPPCDGAVTFSGFNLHASVRIAAHDDVGRERLFRYCLRPPFSLERLHF
jgi:hypothetical protein